MAKAFEVIQEVTVDVSRSIPAPTVFCKQADNVVRVLRVKIQDDKENYPIPAGFTARLRGTKNDGTRIYLDARSASDNVAEFILTQNALAAYGKATCEVELSNDAGDVVKSCNLILNVQKAAMDEGAVESTDEFQSLDAAVAGAQAAQKAAENAANKTAADAERAAKSAEDAGNTAKDIKDSMAQISENKEAVSQLKEDLKEQTEPAQGNIIPTNIYHGRYAYVVPEQMKLYLAESDNMAVSEYKLDANKKYTIISSV